MLVRRNHKAIVFLCALLVLVFTIGTFLFLERQYCMDVPLIQESDIQAYTVVSTIDISQLRMNGEKIAADVAENTVYISQSSDKLLHYSYLQGKLESVNPAHSLFFVKNAALEDITSAVQSGTTLSLLIVDDDTCQLVNVVITTLPVLKIDGAITHQNEEGRDVLSGMVTLWAGFDPSTGAYSTKTNHLQWHVRGNASSGFQKKPFKLSLKDRDGNNANDEFLGLGSDDDWILNPMNYDDTKIREKFAMDLWNQYLSQGLAQNRMSTGEYVELIINNDYQGLYLLQRRIDQKYLQIDLNHDILFKGGNTWSPSSLQEGYEIIYSPYSQEKTYQILEAVLSAHEQNAIDTNASIKIKVFLNFISALDNSGYKNMFYLIQQEGDHFIMSFIPWDTDMSMGVTWTNGFVYDYTKSVESYITCIGQHNVTKDHLQLNDMVASYWKQMRKQIYTEENFRELLTESIATINNSGAYLRDMQKWGTRYGEADTQDALFAWLADRLTVVDSQYAD